MKRLLKFVITILAIAVLIGSAAWYLLIYNPMFLHDALIRQARSSAASGNYSMAFWCCEQAEKLSDQPDPELAMEIANWHLNNGNYTKAEYTLTMAIRQQPTKELYLRLSRVYVEQDKLLDANNLIASIEDASIRAELEAMRPAVPTADPAPGFYDSYITVNVSGTDGTLYVTDDGSYPSTWKEAYAEPYTLPGGETTLLAMTVGENGLVSPLAELGYTVVGVIEPVTIQDAAVESAVREMLGMAADKVLYTNDLWNITEFELPEGAQSVEDLSKLIYLESLTASQKDFGDSTVFEGLTNLKSVTLSDCIVDASVLEQLAALPGLTKLAMVQCSLSNIQPLANAPALTYLDLGSNAIRDIAALSGLSTLEHLDLNHNALTSVIQLSGLTNLKYLDVSYNSLLSISDLSGCKAMNYLDISHNDITTLTAVDQMAELEHFYASHNNIENVGLVAKCIKLKTLDISYNALFDISALSTLTAMTDFDFSHNQVVELPELPVDCALVNINGEYNLLTSLEQLADLYWLDYVYMDYNEGITSIDALQDCPNLVQVNVYGTGVTDVSALIAHSIIVNYNPVQ